MRRTVVTLLLISLLAVAALLTAAPASACSCAGSTVKESFDRADAVFTGSLVSREAEPTGGAGSSTDPALHVFRVDSVHKGTAHQEQGVVSPRSGASCGLELTGEGPFVVFATRSGHLGGSPFTEPAEGQYAASLCGGTAPATPELEAELAALTGLPADPGISDDPLPGVAGTEPATSSRMLPAMAGAGAVVVLAVGALLLRRRLASGR